MPTLSNLIKQHIRVVMVDTSHPGNIGAAARAMKNMGHGRLYLVNPKQFPDVQATARAAGADDILAQATVTTTVAEALKDCTLVFGCSARHRHLSWPVVTPASCATHTIAALQRGEEIGLLFGNEQSGLDNSLFKHCHYQLHIPSNPEYASLNLAAAIQVVVYEIYQAAVRPIAPNASGASTSTPLQLNENKPVDPLASGESLDSFYTHLEKVLWAIKFLNPAHPKRLMQRLQRLFNRAQLARVEVTVLRGILTSIEYAIGAKQPPAQKNTNKANDNLC